MDLSYAEVTYFIQQVALSAASFGVADSDLAIVGAALASTFDVSCAPLTTVIPSQGPQLQSICIDSTCPLAVNATCDLYQTNVTKPTSAGTATSSTPASTSTGVAPITSAGSAASLGVGFGAVVGGLVVLLL